MHEFYCIHLHAGQIFVTLVNGSQFLQMVLKSARRGALVTLHVITSWFPEVWMMFHRLGATEKSF